MPICPKQVSTTKPAFLRLPLYPCPLPLIPRKEALVTCPPPPRPKSLTGFWESPARTWDWLGAGARGQCSIPLTLPSLFFPLAGATWSAWAEGAPRPSRTPRKCCLLLACEGPCHQLVTPAVAGQEL